MGFLPISLTHGLVLQSHLCGLPASNSTLDVSPFRVKRRAATSGDSVLPLPYIMSKIKRRFEHRSPEFPSQRNMMLDARGIKLRLTAQAVNNPLTGPIPPCYKQSPSTKTTTSGASTAIVCHTLNSLTAANIITKKPVPRVTSESNYVPFGTRASWLPCAGGKGIRTPDLWLAKPPL